jgi:hypothetical protein
MLVITETKGMISKKNLRARFQHVWITWYALYIFIQYKRRLHYNAA